MTTKSVPIAITLGAAILSLGCETQITETDLLGQWGGDHVMVQITADGAQVEYDCAHGTIEETIRPDVNGRFTVTGTHVFEHGGPVRQDEPPDEHPATYNGTTDGRSLTYTVTVTDTNQDLGPFELRLGEQARLFKCL